VSFPGWRQAPSRRRRGSDAGRIRETELAQAARGRNRPSGGGFGCRVSFAVVGAPGRPVSVHVLPQSGEGLRGVVAVASPDPLSKAVLTSPRLWPPAHVASRSQLRWPAVDGRPRPRLNSGAGRDVGGSALGRRAKVPFASLASPARSPPDPHRATPRLALFARPNGTYRRYPKEGETRFDRGSRDAMRPLRL